MKEAKDARKNYFNLWKKAELVENGQCHIMLYVSKH